MNNILPAGFKVVYQDDFVTKAEGVINGHRVELGRVTFGGNEDWTCDVDGRNLFTACKPADAMQRMKAWKQAAR